MAENDLAKVMDVLLKNAAYTQAVHNTDELPLILGNTQQAKEYLSRVGEWDDKISGKKDGLFHDDYVNLVTSGIGRNQKEVAEDGSFVDIFSMKAPSGLLYIFEPLVAAFDKLVEGPHIAKCKLKAVAH